MPYYYHGSKILAPYSITSNEPMFDITTVSLKTQRVSQGYQRWELSFNVLNNDEAEADSLLGALLNFDEVETMVMPQLTSLIGKTELNIIPDVQAGATSGSTTIYMDGASVIGTIPKGAFVKFSNHDKVYIVTAPVTFTGSGAVALPIYPSLRVSVNTSTNLEVNENCNLSYYRSIDNQTGITFTDGILSNPGTIYLIEAL